MRESFRLLSVACLSLALAACGSGSVSSAPESASTASPEAAAATSVDTPAAVRAAVEAAMQGEPECISLLGEKLYRVAKSPTDALEDEERLEAARKESAAAPDDPAKLIWFGRMQANAGHFRMAKQTFAEGAKRFPDDARMYRHLGHRQITMRDFESAARTLEKAEKLAADKPDEPEPPTKIGAPTIDSLKQNIYYHLAIARFMLGDYAKSEEAWRRCYDLSANPDSLCSATHWLWMTLSRQGKHKEAADLLVKIPKDLKVLEYSAYRDLCSLYRGEFDGAQHFQSLDPKGVDYATFGFGLANWQLVKGQKERAEDLFRAVAKSESWMAFGRIGAEVEVKRLTK